MAKIEDFGEKIGGARKDIASALKESLREYLDDEDIFSLPLTKLWPDPDPMKLQEEGIPSKSVALVRAIRDCIPRKPNARRAWMVKDYVNTVRIMRELSSVILSGEESFLGMVDIMRKKMSPINCAHALVKSVMYEQAPEASFKNIDIHFYSKRESRLVSILATGDVTGYSKALKFEMEIPFSLLKDWTPTLAMDEKMERLTSPEVLEKLEETFDDYWINFSLENKTSQKKKKKVDLSIYEYRTASKPGYYIGGKIGKEYIDLCKFDSPSAAREYLSENRETLEEKIEAMRQIPPQRRETNEERTGESFIEEDVTPDVFQATFAPRGVEFGNWVEDDMRRVLLLQSAEALLDLASVIDVPDESICMDGDLAIAFGARGSGGKNAPSAHYEPERRVVNLTKKAGPGSLAHEWFHALDNFLFRKLGGKENSSDPFVSANISNLYAGSLKDNEIVAAFADLFTLMKKETKMMDRALNLDKRRSSPYYSKRVELAARAFEKYVFDSLAEEGIKNDFLCNFLSPKEYEIAASSCFFTEGTTSYDEYPYPLDQEAEVLKEPFGRIVEVFRENVIQNEITR